MADTLTDLRCYAAHLDGEAEDIVDAGIAEIMALQSKLQAAEKTIEAMHAARNVLAGDINLGMATLNKELQGRLSTAVEALRECKRLAEESGDGFLEDSPKWLNNIYCAAHEALKSFPVERLDH